MKRQILDAPFEDEQLPKKLKDLLEENEDIIWTGSPKQNAPFTGVAFLGTLFLCCGFIINPFIIVYGMWAVIIPIIILIVGHLFLTAQKNQRKAQTKYYITSKRIFFKLPHPILKRIYDIRLSEIKDVTVLEHSSYTFIRREKENWGVIYLVVKDPSAIPFTTYNFEIRERRHQPTLELVKNPDEVADLIRKGIRREL